MISQLIGLGVIPAIAVNDGTSTLAKSGTVDFGRSADGGQDCALQFTASQNGHISSVEISVTTGAAVNCTAKLYSNNAGSPGTQIGTASGAVSMTAGTKTFTFSTTDAVVVASTSYWLVLDFDGGAQIICDGAGDPAGFGWGDNDTITSITDEGSTVIWMTITNTP